MKLKIINDYILAIENPDSIGWDSKRQIWVAPTLPGYDKNQRGIGLDIRTNKRLAKYLKENPRVGNYLTKEEEEFFRNDFLDYLDEVFTTNTNKMRMSNISEKKKAMAFGLMYQGHGKSLWEDKGDGLHQAFLTGDDQIFQNAISEFYRTRNPERMRNHDVFWQKEDAKMANTTTNRFRKKLTVGHVEQPDALYVAKPNIVFGQANGGKLRQNRGRWDTPPAKFNKILDTIKKFNIYR